MSTPAGRRRCGAVGGAVAAAVRRRSGRGARPQNGYTLLAGCAAAERDRRSAAAAASPARPHPAPDTPAAEGSSCGPLSNEQFGTPADAGLTDEQLESDATVAVGGDHGSGGRAAPPAAPPPELGSSVQLSPRGRD
eukprot:gene10366-2382_t